MPLLRKTGVRSPWMPAPLQASLERVRPALVVAAIVPAVLLGGNAQAIGRLPRAENPQPPRPAVVVQQPAQPARAFVWAPRPFDAGVVAPPDRLSPTLVVADPPDSSLAQPNVTLIGRLPRAEDTSRPARPASVQRGQQPTPTATAQAVGVVHDAPIAAPERLSITQVIPGQQPKPTGSALSVGTVKDAPTDRVALTTSRVGPQPIPSAGALFVGHPFDPTPAPPPAPTPSSRTAIVRTNNRSSVVELAPRVASVRFDDRTFEA